MNESPIHVGLEYEEAINSKKNVLSSEIELLEMIKNLKKYKNLRIEELKIKDSLYKKIMDTLREIKKLEKILPKVKEKKEIKKEVIKKEKPDEDIEFQLREIRGKLRAMSNQ